MNRKIISAAIMALMISATCVATNTLYAAAAKQTNMALADAVNGMMADYKAGRYADALAKAKVADAIGGMPANVTQAVHQMIIAAAIAMKDYRTALAQIDREIKNGEGDREYNLKNRDTILQKCRCGSDL